MENMVTVFLFGKKYEVPDSLTIMEAMEYSGYQLVRGCGCRNGFCGACATIYRIAGDRELKACLACSTRVENNMYVATLPFFPLVKEVYDMEKLKPTQTVMMQLYPEIYACVGCNACTKACTQGLNVMQYIAYAQRGEFDKCAEESFDYVKELGFTTDKTVVMCGPPIMIKFTLAGLMELGFAREQVYTTMELKMKCGLGKCGRCNIGDKYVCKDGPVFRFDQLDELPNEY